MLVVRGSGSTIVCCAGLQHCVVQWDLGSRMLADQRSAAGSDSGQRRVENSLQTVLYYTQ